MIENTTFIISIITKRRVTLNKFKELCPQADKNIKNAKDTFLMMLSIARNNVYSEKFSNNDGEIVFTSRFYPEFASGTGTVKPETRTLLLEFNCPGMIAAGWQMREMEIDL